MAQITAFGKEIKKKLVDLDQTQNWLIGQVKSETGLYLDSSYLSKIQMGERNPTKIIVSICKILDISAPLSNH